MKTVFRSLMIASTLAIGLVAGIGSASAASLHPSCTPWGDKASVPNANMPLCAAPVTNPVSPVPVRQATSGYPTDAGLNPVAALVGVDYRHGVRDRSCTPWGDKASVPNANMPTCTF